MKRMLWFAVLAVVLWSSSVALAANSVVVESKSVALNATGVTIGIFVSNDVAIKNVVAPFELRSTDGGSFITNMKRSYPAGTRLDGKLSDIRIINWYDGNTVGTCKQAQAGGYTAIVNDTQDVFFPVVASPEAVLFSYGKIFGPDLPAGADGAAAPQMLLTVDVNGLNGKFEVDTTCTNPANHLVFARSTGTPVALMPSFTKGEITVGTPIPPNQPPVASDTTVTTDEDVALNVPHLPASDPDAGQVISYSPLILPSHGVISVMNGSTGQFLYTPNANYCGPDSIQYMVCDNAPSPLCAFAWVHINVTCLNDAPVAKDSVIATNQDTPRSVTGLSATDVDAGQTLTFAVLSGPSHGSLGATFVPATGAFTYTPTAGYSGPDSIKFTVCDNGAPLKCDTGTVRITVNLVNQPPVAICKDVTVNAGPSCTAAADIDSASYDPDAGDPITKLQRPAGPYSKGTTLVWLIVTDSHGAKDSCSANVTVVDATPPSITCPANISARTTPAGCDTTITFSGARAATATDNCPSLGAIVYTAPGVTISGNPASGVFPLGTTTVTASVTDQAGNSSQCQFTVTVSDLQKPVVSCPGNITQGNDPGQCNAIVTFTATATDNCAMGTIVATPSSGSAFPKGTTPVKVVATDAAGNKDSCTFNVTIQDTTKPTISCPSNIIADNSLGSCGAIVNYTAPTANDNCPGVLVGSVPASGSFFPVGVTTVTATATDAAGNQQTCTFSVTVNDTEKPTVSCPGPITVSVPSGQTSAVVTYGVTSGDNCPGLVNVLTPPSGSTFPLGTTPVKCVTTDAAGLKDSCEFTVTVEVGNSAPVIDPIPAKTVLEGSNLNFGVAANDVDGNAAIILSASGKPFGSTFVDNGSGSGTFDWTPACDQGGQVYNVQFIAFDGSLADTETVAITVTDIPEVLVATPNNVTINYQTGPPLPAPIPVSLTDPGCSGQLSWQASSDAAWLSSDTDTGTTPSNVYVVVDPTSLGVGDYTGTVTFGTRTAGKSESVVSNTVTVHLHVGPAPHDSVWVTNGSGKLGDTIAVDVNFCNNHEATGISVGLQYWPHMHSIGGSFAGSRVEGLGAKSITIDGGNRTICIAAIPIPPESRILEGCGKLATLYFVYDSAGSCPSPESSMVVSFPIPPGCSTMLTDTIPATVIPSFVPGIISLVCPPRICGYVKDGSGAPIANAMVQLWSSYPSGTLITEFPDDPDGAFCFLNLPNAGPFDLRIFAPGYCTKIMTGVGPTDVTPLDVVLDALPAVPTEPSFAWYWSDNAAISGVPLMPGDVITAVDPNGIVCGKTVVTQSGKYNIYVMGDDQTTPGTDEGAGSGDLITLYLNCTCALLAPGTWTSMTGTQFDANFDCSSKTVDIPLCDPWTLFSFNVTPANPSPASVLASIAGQYQIVFTSTCAYGPLSWDQSRPFNDLTSMDPFHGFWLKTTGPGVGPISVTGVPVPVSTPLDLCEGWNLISYLPDSPDTFSHALGSIASDYSHVFGFECGKGYVSWDASRPAFLNDLTCMRPLMGYWLKATVNTTLTYPSAGYTCNEGGPILSKPVNLLANVSQTPWVADFWSVANTTASGIHSGDNLTVRNSAGVICGECLVGSDGAFLVHVYGDDPSTAQVEGAVKGEALQFEINGAPAYVESGSAVWNERESVKLTLVAGKSSPVPSEYSLLQNYPNPFNPSTVIRFRLPAASDAQLTVYNVLGQKVRVLFNGSLQAGEHSYEWNGQNDNGESVQSGIYFYRLETPSWSDSKKMTFLK